MAAGREHAAKWRLDGDLAQGGDQIGRAKPRSSTAPSAIASRDGGSETLSNKSAVKAACTHLAS
jgi:hypothetical protein